MVRREREMAVRAALGASRGRLIRQTLTESTLLSLAGGAAGLLLGSVALKLLVAFAAKLTNRASEIKIDGWVLLFTFVVSIVTGLAFGLAPAFFSSRRDLSASIKEGAGLGTSGGPKHHIIRSALIVAQVAASFVLLIGAGLMLRSLVKLENVNPGFNPERVLVMRTSPDWSKYDTNDKVRLHNKRLIEAVESQPGISSAALASTFPMDPAGITFGPMMTNDFTIEGRVQNDKQPKPVADFRTVSPGYFQTVEIPLVAGRTFTEADNEDAPLVVIINQSMARHRWPDENPVGKRVSIDGGKDWATIIGVVGDVRQYGLDRQPTDELYEAEAQNPMVNNLLVRTSGDPASLATMLRDVVHNVDPDTAVDRVIT
ncbi:MAG: ABC transporter permease, partial [Blastocatellia bacterium]